jgi:hypothetical protein
MGRDCGGHRVSRAVRNAAILGLIRPLSGLNLVDIVHGPDSTPRWFRTVAHGRMVRQPRIGRRTRSRRRSGDGQCIFFNEVRGQSGYLGQRLAGHFTPVDLAPKFYPVLSSLQRFWVAAFGAVAAGCGAEPFRLRSTASRRGLIV